MVSICEHMCDTNFYAKVSPNNKNSNYQHVISPIHLKAVMHSVLKMHERAMHMLHDSVLLHYDYHCDL